jgi:hypothetical protein
MPERLRVRGFPLLQMLIVAVVFAAASVPVWSLTRPATANAAPAAVVAMAAAAPAPVAGLQPITVAATFAPAPADFQVQCDGQTVLAGHAPERQFSAVYQTPLPAEGADFVVRASWPAPGDSAPAGPAAARVILRLPNGAEVDKTFWTAPGETLAEIVTVPGTGGAAR